MRPLFSTLKPRLVASLTDSTANDAVSTIRNALYDGADAFMLHLEAMEPSERTEENLTRIMNYCCDKPLFTMNYRTGDRPDEELVAEQLLAVRCGASMIDMMGDMFDPSPMELTTNPKAIKCQQDIIEEVHSHGGEVLMSSHTWVYMDSEELLTHCRTLKDRGADFVKIAMSVHSEEEALDAMKSTTLVSRELGVPFLHVCMGQYGKLHRAISPMLGSCFGICVQSYTPAGHKEKPLLRSTRAVFDNIDWKPARNPLLGTTIGIPPASADDQKF